MTDGRHARPRGGDIAGRILGRDISSDRLVEQITVGFVSSVYLARATDAVTSRFTASRDDHAADVLFGDQERKTFPANRHLNLSDSPHRRPTPPLLNVDAGSTPANLKVVIYLRRRCARRRQTRGGAERKGRSQQLTATS